MSSTVITNVAQNPQTATCRVCGRSGLRQFFRLEQVPVNSCVLLDDEATARRYPRGDIVLALCEACGLVQNIAFDERLVRYSEAYEDSQAHSPRWVDWARGIAAELVDRYGLRGRHALEVGCGKGDFLAILAEVGQMTGTGYDPAFRPGPLVQEQRAKLRFEATAYTTAQSWEVANLVCCRHTLEHLPNPWALLDALVAGPAGRSDAVTLLEVPDAAAILTHAAFWDVYYEHCSYFTADSLARIVRAAGLSPVRVEHAYDGQYLLLEAVPGTRPATPHLDDDPLARLAATVDRFEAAAPARIAALREELDATISRGCTVVLWGASSKAVSYLVSLRVTDEVAGVVDVNPTKWGTYLAGTGHRVLAPRDIPSVAPDVVLLMNPTYRREVAVLLRELDVCADLRTPEGR